MLTQSNGCAFNHGPVELKKLVLWCIESKDRYRPSERTFRGQFVTQESCLNELVAELDIKTSKQAADAQQREDVASKT